MKDEYCPHCDDLLCGCGTCHECEDIVFDANADDDEDDDGFDTEW